MGISKDEATNKMKSADLNEKSVLVKSNWEYKKVIFFNPKNELYNRKQTH